VNKGRWEYTWKPIFGVRPNKEFPEFLKAQLLNQEVTDITQVA